MEDTVASVGWKWGGCPCPQRSVSKGSVSRVSLASYLEEAGSRAGGVKQPVLRGCNGPASPNFEHITDVKRREAAAGTNEVQMHGGGQPPPGAGLAGAGLPAQSYSCGGEKPEQRHDSAP